MNRRIVLGLILGVLAGQALGQSGATPSATQIAERIEKNAKTIVYAAVRKISIQSSNGVRTFDERILRSGEKLYLSYYPGTEYADQQVYELNGKRYTYNKSTNEARVGPVRGGFKDTVELIKKSDASRKLGVSYGDAIAGRKTYYIEIPSSRGRGGSHRMWIDREKYVILKRSFGANEREEMGGFEFKQIDFRRSLPSDKFVLPRGAKIITVQDELRRLAKSLSLKPMMLVKAGKLELLSAGQMEFQGQKIIRQFYSDGDKRVSLFVMKQTDDGLKFSSDRVKYYRWNSGGMTLILLGGDFSESELKRLSSSVKA